MKKPVPHRIFVPGLHERSAAELMNGPLELYPRLQKAAAEIAIFGTRYLYFNDPNKIITPDSPPRLYVCNHRDYWDTLIIGTALYKLGLDPQHYIAMAELFGVPENTKVGLLRERSMRVAAWLIGHSGGIPIDRAKAASKLTLREEQARLEALCDFAFTEEGRSVVIYPEAGFGIGNVIEPVGSTALRVAKNSGVEIVILGLAGTENATLNFLRHGQRPSVAMSVHQLVDLSNEHFNAKALTASMQDAFDSAREVLNGFVA